MADKPETEKKPLVRREYADIEPARPARWSEEDVQRAVDKQILGEFGHIFRLFRVMLQDADFAADIRRRVSGLGRSEMVVQPFDATDYQAKLVAILQRNVWQMLPEKQLARLFTDYHGPGISLARYRIELSEAGDGFLP